MSDNFWAATTALGTCLVALATFLLAIGVLVELQKYRDERKKQEDDDRYKFYSQFDTIYYDIQKQIIARPHLSDPAGAKDDEQKCQYSAFAFMVWNFIETICDYSEKDPFLHKTWGCIVQYEGNLHRDWFLDKKNNPKFKPEFVERAEKDIVKVRV